MLKGGPQNLGKRFPPEPLTKSEVQLIMNATSARGACGVRDRALIAVLYRGGLRISELLRLMHKDINLERGEIAVLWGKGGRRRVVAVDDDAVALLRHWLDERALWGIGARARLFCTLKGRPMSDTQVRDRLKALARKAGIEKRIHPHGFRHTFASELADENVDIRIIQHALGHVSLEGTQVYVDHLRPNAVTDVLKRRTWKKDES